MIIQNWQIKKLSEICNLITDGVHNSPKYIDSGIPMLDAKHIKDNFSIDDENPTKFISQETDNLLSKRCKPLANDLLISSRGTIGKIAIVKEGQNFNIMGNIILLRVPNNVISKYVAFSLQSKLDEIQSISRGVAQKGLYLNQVRNFKIPLPPIPEQKRIVAILDEAFEGIDRAISNTEKNLSNARELFESYLNSIFSQKGEGWEVKKLGEVCEIERNQGIDINLPYIGMEHIESNTARFIGSYQIQTVKSSTFRFNSNHILYGRLRPYLNKVLAPDFEGHCSTEIFPIKPRECLNKNFLLYWLLMDLTVNNINKTCTGARMPRANMNDVLKFDFLLPPLTEQKNIVKKLDEISTKTQRIESIYRQKIAALKELKQSILQKAFTGELTADNPKIEEWEVAA